MPIIENIQQAQDYESIILTTDLRAQIKQMLNQNTYSSVGDFLNDVQKWLRNQNKFLIDGYVVEHIQAIIEGQSIQLEWTYPGIETDPITRNIRCYINDENLVNLLSNPAYDDLAVYVNSMGIPWVKHGVGRLLYFEEVYPMHQALLEGYGGKFENKI